MCLKSRFFVKFSLVLSVAIAVLSSCESYERNPRSETRFLLGTTCTVTLYDRAPDELLTRVFDRIARIEARMSVQLADSEISAVNRAAGRAPVRVSDDTFEVIARGLEYSALSRGAFDISVGPLVSLWGIGTDHATIPRAEDVRRDLALVDYRGVKLDEQGRTVFLERPGMQLDLGGIAKGYAADEAARILGEAGIRHGLIVFGGNIFAIGSKPDGSRWRIGIQNPDDQRGSYMGILEVDGKTIVTSGTYERYFEVDGVRYHHILDTTTGYPVRNHLTSTTIVTEQSIRADALSTAVFALGLERGLALVRSLPGVEAVFITDDHRVYVTPGLKPDFRVTAAGFTLAD